MLTVATPLVRNMAQGRCVHIALSSVITLVFTINRKTPSFSLTHSVECWTISLLLRRLLITTLLDWDVYIVIIPFNNVVIPIRHMDVLGFRSPQPLKVEKNKGCKPQSHSSTSTPM